MRINQWQRSLFLVVCVVGGIAPGVLEFGELTRAAEGEPISRAQSQQVVRDIPSLNEVEQPLTTAERLLVQQPAPTPALQPTPAPTTVPTLEVVQVRGVQANPTEKGVEVILQTTQGKQLPVVNRSADNRYIADIPNAQLSLPNGEAFVFRSQKPITGITEITVTNFDANTIRVTVTGEAGVPTVQLYDSPQEGLVFGVVSAAASTPPQQPPQTQPTPQPVEPGSETQLDEPAAEEEEEIEIVVTGEQEETGYSVPDATTATRTDTPIRDIPQSIQVVPRQVLEDRNVQRELEALETVSGVVDNDTKPNGLGTDVAIRGFVLSESSRLRNGLRSESFSGFTPIGTIERVEVLKGPASVLFGALDPGGVINYVTRQPLAEPYYRIGFEAGNYGFYQPSIDLSGPLTKDGNVLYRLIAAYQSGGDFKDSTPIDEQAISIAPSITFRLGDRTDLNISYEYSKSDRNFWFEPLLSDGNLIPRNVFPSYFSSSFGENQRVGYTLNHEFNDSWQLRHNLSATFSTAPTNDIGYTSLLEDRFLTDYLAFTADFSVNKYFGLIDLVGEFNTGSISHQLVAGFDFDRQVQCLKCPVIGLHV